MGDACVVKCESKSGHKNYTFGKKRTTFSNFANYSPHIRATRLLYTNLATFHIVKNNDGHGKKYTIFWFVVVCYTNGS